MEENSVVIELGDFGLKISTVPLMFIVGICVAYLAAFNMA